MNCPRICFPFVTILLIVLLPGVTSLEAVGPVPQADSAKFVEAVGLYEEREFNDSHRILSDLIEAGSIHPVYYYYLGLIYHEVEEYERAKENYFKAAELDSTYPDPWSDLAVLHRQNGDLEAAIKYGRKCVSIDSTFTNGYLNLGTAYTHSGDTAAANKAFLTAAALDPDRVYDLGTQILVQNNSPEYALLYFEYVLAIYPDHPLALLYSAQCFRMLDLPEEAEIRLSYGVETCPMDFETFDIIYASYFRILFDLGKFEEILSNSAFRVGSEYAPSHYFNALAHFRLGNLEESEKSAREYFRLAEETSPEDLTSWLEQEANTSAERQAAGR